jgi:HSP20 family molecular chaperone IbpA
MKSIEKVAVALALLGSIAVASGNLTISNNQQQTSNNDPFANMNKIFAIQMKQMRQMQQRMDAMFGNFEQNFQTPSMMQTPMLVHSSGVLSSGFVDKGDHYELKIRVNDLKDSKVSIASKDGMITITTTLNKKEEKTKGKYGKIISYANSSSVQSFTLPSNADVSTIKADQKGNVITITLQKQKTAAPNGKVIPINKKK